MTKATIPFDAADHLDDKAVMTSYLAQAMEYSDQHELLRALIHVARGQGMDTIGERAGLGREILYRALCAGTNPSFGTVVRVI